MNKFKWIKPGGLHQKIFNLILIMVILLIGTNAISSMLQQKNISDVVKKSSHNQQESIKTTSEATLYSVMDTTMTENTRLQADTTENFFLEAKEDVLTLNGLATSILSDEGFFSAHSFKGPKDMAIGEAGIWAIGEEGVDVNSSASLALLANMSETMLAMYENSSFVESLFVATTDGCVLFANDCASYCILENGEVYPYNVSEREWFKKAISAGELIFTDVVTDYFTNERDIVCAAPVFRNGQPVAVVGANVYLSTISENLKNTASDDSFLCVIDGNGKVIMSPNDTGIFAERTTAEAWDLRENDNKELSKFVKDALKEETGIRQVSIYERDYYLCGSPLSAIDLTVVNVTKKEVVDKPTESMLSEYDKINAASMAEYRSGVRRSVWVIVFITLIMVALSGVAGFRMAQNIVRPIVIMTERINALKGGDTIFEMEDDYHTNDEIEVLAESFATLSKRTKDYIEQMTTITAEKERIGTELSLARKIQADMLPSVYPAFPERKEFDLFASMTPAKEVGGDFYDFFMVDDDHLGLVIADVSGKGVPAAMFMMFSKNIIANNAMRGKSPAIALRDANASICGNNSEEMFVTVWLGILEISTGKLRAANAGHEYPVLKHGDGGFDLFKDKHGFAVGWFDDSEYEEYEIQLEAGDRIFLYTDGVPEATDANENMFETNRLIETLNQDLNASPEQMLSHVWTAVGAFVDEAEQFDDLTMLAVEYRGANGGTPSEA